MGENITAERAHTEGDKMKLELRHYLVGTSAMCVAAMLSAQPAKAQTVATTPSAQSNSTVPELIVTAQKRQQNVNKVPMSITAITGQQLVNAGVTQVKDLAKFTPGFTYADSGTGTPIFTIRGVGFSDIGLSARPTVSAYNDQAPLPFSIETRGVALDLERVEVLKGPQGTLFGTNSTGGALNFIAAKPTSDFQAGADLSYGRFNATQISGFVSGPLVQTVTARLAIEHDGSDAWQNNYVNGEKLGIQDFWNGRLTVDWTPNDRFKAALTLSGWYDHGDTQAEQYIGVVPTTPFPVPQLSAYPIAPHNDQAAGWDPGRGYRKNNNFVQANARLDYTLSPTLTLTSLTSYSHYREDQLSDLDGTSVSDNYFKTIGDLESISEELRLAGTFADRGHFTIGGNYDHDSTNEFDHVFSPASSISNEVSFLFVEPLQVDFDLRTNERADTAAGFASVDYDVTNAINVYGGVRYTDFREGFSGCSADDGSGVFAAVFTIIDGAPVAPGGCTTVAQNGKPGLIVSSLHETNVSWRAGAQWTVAPSAMFYFNVSQGYKAGGFPLVPANNFNSLLPVNQESVLAYEGGFKVGLFDHALQLNGAVFHYDYTDKQVLGSETLPGIGTVLALINIPKSAIDGAELQIATTPVSGLSLSGSATYLNSGVTNNFYNTDPLGNTINFKGEQFPNTPHWMLSALADYKWSLNDRFNGFVGGDVSYQSQTQSEFGNLPLFQTTAYALLDLRAGVAAKDGTWRLWLWGRNVTNTYYWTAATHVQDTIVRYMGMPATYGVSLSYRFR
jgi:outer membrane receptor protein involved in Fe transport